MSKSQTIQNMINNNQITNIDVLSDQQLSDFYDEFIELLDCLTICSKLHPSDDSYIDPKDVDSLALGLTNDQF